MLTDSHAHLDHEQFDTDRDEVIQRARDAGVGIIINPCITPESCRKGIDLAERYGEVYAAVAVHPTDGDQYNESSIDELRELTRHEKVVAIGETGLDHYWDGVPHDMQERMFREHIRLAVDTGLPLIVHSRNAEDEVLRILKEERAGRVRGVLHCFGGTFEQAKQARTLGFLIGFGGVVTFKNADRLDLATHLVTDSLLIETDSPYLAPHPHRGTRNEPAYVAHVAAAIADAGPFSLEDIQRITTHNTRKLFKIGDIDASRIAYNIRYSLYLNITNQCTLSCAFCPKIRGDFSVKGHNLELAREPSADEILDAVGDPSQWREIVFCGYGESTLRLDVIKEVASRLRQQGVTRIRLDTDGLANVIYRRDVTPELAGLIDAVSVSLNAPDPATYQRICRPNIPDGITGEEVWRGVQDFIVKAKRHIPEVTATMVAMPNLDVEAVRKIAERLGVDFRAREYNAMGEGYDSARRLV